MRLMMRWVKIVIYFFLLLMVMLFAAWFTIPHWLPRLASYWLPTGVQLSLSQPRWQNNALTLPAVTLNSEQCLLATLSHLSVAYPLADNKTHHYWLVHSHDVNLNSECFANLPKKNSNQQTPLVINDVLSAIPPLSLTIDHFSLAPWQAFAGKLTVNTVDNQPSFAYQNEKLALTGQITNQNKLSIKQFSLQLPEQSVTLQGDLTLPLTSHQLPEKGQLNAEVLTKHYANPLLITMNWQDNAGYLTVEDKTKHYALVELPWHYDPQQFQIINGRWQWLDMEKPLTGHVDLTIDQWQKGLDTTRFTGRINLLTQGKRGKGNIVLSVKPSEINLLKTGIPFQLTGNINIADIIISVSLPMRISGFLESPQIAFLPGSLFRARGNITDKLSIKEIRLPLAGTRLTMQGFSGRLQSIVSIADEQWGICKIHFDGQADNFIPDRGIWRWRYWGTGYLPPLNANWDIAGKGSWHDTLISFDSQSTGFDQIKYGIVTMLSPRLQLTKPLQWQRDKAMPEVSGELLLTTQKTWFRRHSYLPPTSITATLTGSDPDNVMLKGLISAKNIQPIIFYSRWDGERLRGEARWPQQPLKVAQSLFPNTTHIKIRNGTFYAQAAFSAAAKQGFMAGGHWVVKEGAAWLKNGYVNGVDFILPWRLKESVWQLGIKSPVQLRIKQLNNLFNMKAISADLQGFYPATLKQPLILSNVKMNLLDGWISIDQLKQPQTDASRLFIRDIDLSYLLQSLKVKQFALSGRINGELPLYLNRKDWIIKDGWLENKGYLTLRLDKDTVDSIEKNNMSAGAAINWLRYLEINRSHANVNLDKQGELMLNAQIYGVSPLVDKRREVRLNFNHKQNIFQLLQSLQFASDLEDKLQQHYENVNQR